MPELLDDWVSMYELCYANPLRFEAGVVSSRPPPQPSEPAITVVVIADEFVDQPAMLAGLANIAYDNYSVILVCPTPRIYAHLAGQLGAFNHVIKVGGVFQPKGHLSGDEVIVSGLQHSTTSYTCVMHAGDVIHPQALARVAAAINETHKAYYYSLAFRVNNRGWAHLASVSRPDARLAVFSTRAALHAANLRPPCECSRAFVWELAQALQPSSELIPETLQFHITHKVDEATDRRYLAFVEEAKTWTALKP